jgi:hypothetical protein
LNNCITPGLPNVLSQCTYLLGLHIAAYSEHNVLAVLKMTHLKAIRMDVDSNVKMKLPLRDLQHFTRLERLLLIRTHLDEAITLCIEDLTRFTSFTQLTLAWIPNVSEGQIFGLTKELEIFGTDIETLNTLNIPKTNMKRIVTTCEKEDC